MLRDRDYGISDVAADALYGQADPEIWDLVSDAEACPKPVILGNIPSVEGRELCVNRASCLFVGFPLRMSILTRTGERAYHRQLLGAA